MLANFCATLYGPIDLYVCTQIQEYKAIYSQPQFFMADETVLTKVCNYKA